MSARVRAGASVPRAAQRLVEPSVVRVQASQFHRALVDSLPLGLVLGGLLVETLLQGFDTPAVPRLFRLKCPYNLPKDAINCRSNSMRQPLHSLDSLKAGRPPTVQGEERRRNLGPVETAGVQ